MKNFLSVLVVGIAMSFFASPVSALTVSPARLEITADPGQIYTGEIEIFNEQNSDKTFFTSYENFEPQGDSGAPYFSGSKDGLATWIETIDQISVKPGERATVPYTINVPQDAQAGGYFAAIFFGTQPPNGSGGGEVSIGGKIGILILFRVSGDVPEGGGLLNFNIKDNQKLFTSLPINFEYRFNNTGGDRVVPLGEIKIKNTFRSNSATLLANKNEGSVLPDSTRKFETLWGDDDSDDNAGFFATAKKQWQDFYFGWYSADLGLTYGLSNQTARSLYHFFIIPWQLLSLIVLVLGIVIIAGKVGLKRYNQFIISKVNGASPASEKVVIKTKTRSRTK